MTDYTVYYGIEHLSRVHTSTSIAFDTETLQLQPEKGKLRLIQFGCLVNRTVVLIDCFDLTEDDWVTLDRFFNNGNRYWLAHNAVFDLAWLQEYGIHPRATRIGCSMLASRLLTNGKPNTKHGLAALVKRYLNVTLPKELQVSDWGQPQLSKDQLLYAARDVQALIELDPLLDKRLQIGDLMGAYKQECLALPAMAQMWRTGLPWNAEALEQCKKDYEYDAKQLGKDFIRELDEALPVEHKLPREGDERITYLKDKLSRMGADPSKRESWFKELENLETDRDIAPYNLRSKDEGSIRLDTKKYKGFNINSPKQLLDKFAAVLGFTPTGADGKPSASRQALRGIAADHEVVQTYLTWKKKEKRRQMVVSIQEKMDPDGFVRASYMQLGADTGRMSCIKPNNQQIPRDSEFRRCVEAPEGWLLVDADFSQMELRLAARLANDGMMIKAFKEGADLHEITAKAIDCDRQIAKSANFGLLYGSGATGLRNYAGASGITMSRKEAEHVRNTWLGTYEGIAKWQVENAQLADKTENTEWPSIRIPVSGMRRYIKGDLNRLTIRCNTPIQGAGAAILKTAIGNLWPLVKQAGEDNVRIAAAVHDEILLLVKEGQAEKWASILKNVMEDAESIWLKDIPALAETSIGKTWGEVH